MATRQRIVEAAAEAFDQRGYAAVNLKEVVEALGLTTGALYYFFKTKEALAVEIVDLQCAAWVPLISGVLDAHEDRLEAIVDLSYRVARACQEDVVVRAGIRLTAERDLINTDLPEPYVGWIDQIALLLREAKERGQVRDDLDVEATAEVLVSFFFGAQAVTWEVDDRRGLSRQLDQFWKLTRPSMAMPPPC